MKKFFLYVGYFGLALGLFFASALPLPVHAATFGDITIIPAHPSDPENSKTKSWFVYDFPTGTVHKDTVYVKNDTKEAKTLKLYAVDAYTTEQGGFALRRDTDERKTVGAWISLSTKEVTLKVGEAKEIAFTYTVPKEVGPGEYAGGIVAEDKAAVSGAGIDVVKKVGVRVYHTVAGEKRVSLSVFDYQTEKLGDGNRRFKVTVSNKGNVSKTVVFEVDLKTRDGGVLSTVKSGASELLPGATATIITDSWDPPVFGFFEAAGRVIAQDTGEVIETLNAIPLVIIPVWLVILIVLAVFIIVFVISRLVDRNRKKRRRH